MEPPSRPFPAGRPPSDSNLLLPDGGHSDVTRKRTRKSRGTGLRCKTGCITCRKRHKKCDEVTPACGNCSRTERRCIWPSSTLSNPPSSSAPEAVQSGGVQNSCEPDKSAAPTNYVVGQQERYPHPQEAVNGPTELAASDGYQFSYSPTDTVSSTDFITADLASVRWLDLLAADAIQANSGFTFVPTPFEQHFLGYEELEPDLDEPEEESSLPEQSRTATPQKLSWQLDKGVVLQNEEVAIFRNFVERCSLWLDVFDPAKQFSTYAIRLALRNTGLMKAILALSARHLSLVQAREGDNATTDPSLAIQYYYETLHYVQTALHYNSYAHSEELLATTLIISTYEMLDESGSGWQRHLKGVFWIQRSQDVNGASGGIRQAVWWAWLRQDVWAAFRERRRALSFWKPVVDYPDLTAHELADRATYLFAQAVNYCADPTSTNGHSGSDHRTAERADELLAMLERWKSFLGDEFKPLTMASESSGNNIFQPIWIHPPQFGVAMQLYYFARILVILHRPAVAGFNGYLKIQKSLSEAVNMICGIATALRDESCQILSSQCLYGAALCVQDQAQRNEIISLITACGERTGWPMSTLKSNLHEEWNKVDADNDHQTPQAAAAPI